MKVVADNKIPFLRGALEPFCEVEYLAGAETTAANVRNADALITRTRTKCNAKLLEGSAVKFIATATIGFDHIDTAYCDKKGIKWTNAPGCNSSSVAQYLTSVLLNLAVKHNITLAGKTLGVVGVGNVGSKVAAVGEALGMRVLLNDPPRAEREGRDNFVDLSRIQTEADFITLHVPLEKSGKYPTYHLADAGFIAGMKNEAFLINSSRGTVCDNQALKQALNNKIIRGAVLDVWENEPDMDLELLQKVDFGTPHIAGYSADGKANGTSMSVNALAEFFNLPLTGWYPDDVPVPDVTEIELSPQATLEAELLDAVKVSYDVAADSRNLLESPATFESQRGNYPLRREFPVFTVRGASDAAAGILQKLGFCIK